MCYHSDCTAPASTILKAPFVRGVCQTHFDALKAELVKLFPQMTKGSQTCHNVALAYVLMSDTAAVLSLLGDLDASINLSGKDCRLSAALEYYETLCWFPRLRAMPIGLLDGAEFRGLIARGWMLKDVGAGPLHGRLTHRLQWHAVMRAMTNHFKETISEPWTMTPLQLYCEFGNPALANGNTSAWGRVFDRQGSDPASGFHAPEVLYASLLKQKGWSITLALSRKQDQDAHNLARAVRHHLKDAASGQGPFAKQFLMTAKLASGQAVNVIDLSRLDAVTKTVAARFGVNVNFSFGELYDYLQSTLFGGGTGTTDRGYKFTFAEQYAVGAGNQRATQFFLDDRKLKPKPNENVIHAKYPPPSPEDIKKRIIESAEGFNKGEAWVIKEGGFAKK